MITINNTEYRNLTEQVQKNKDDIARHYEIDRVIADFGIRVLGRLDSTADLPQQAAVYGDAYAIGTETPYDYYVWTRANEAIGEPVDYWMDIGSLAIPGPTGPQGEQGVQGPQGIPGSKWSSGRGTPISTNANTGDQYLDTLTGIVYEWTGSIWEGRSSIQGPQGLQGLQGIQGIQGLQGPQGPIGPKGDVGGFVNIAGILATVDLLPTPEQLQNLTVAYLIGAAEPYDLYIQIGEDSTTAEWTNTGPFNAATLITDHGAGINTIEIDSNVTEGAYKLPTSAAVYSALQNGEIIPFYYANNQNIRIGSGGDNYANYTTNIGLGNHMYSGFTYAFGRGLDTRKQNQTVIGSFSEPNHEDTVILAAGTGTGAGQIRKNALVANEKRVQVETPPTQSLAVRNIWLDPEYDPNHHYAVPFGDIYAVYDPEDESRITALYVGQN